MLYIKDIHILTLLSFLHFLRCGPFLKLVLKGCVDWSKENNCTLITEKEMQIINDKRSKEKKK